MTGPEHPRDTGEANAGATSQGRENVASRPEVTRDSSGSVTLPGQCELFPDWQPRELRRRTWGNP